MARKEPIDITYPAFLKAVAKTKPDPDMQRLLFTEYEYDIPKDIVQLACSIPEGAYMKVKDTPTFFIPWEARVWPHPEKMFDSYQLACIPFFFIGGRTFIVYNLRQKKWFDLDASLTVLSNPQKTMESALTSKHKK